MCYDKRELEYRIPRLHSRENSRRFPDMFGDVRKNNASLLQVVVEKRAPPCAPVDLRRKPEPVPRAQVLFIYIYIYIHTYICIYIYIYIMYIYIYIYTYIIYIYICITGSPFSGSPSRGTATFPHNSSKNNVMIAMITTMIMMIIIIVVIILLPHIYSLWKGVYRFIIYSLWKGPSRTLSSAPIPILISLGAKTLPPSRSPSSALYRIIIIIIIIIIITITITN